MLKSKEYGLFYNCLDDPFGYPDTLVRGRTSAAYKFGCQLVYDSRVNTVLDIGSGHGHGITTISRELKPYRIISAEIESDFLQEQKKAFGEKQENTSINFLGLDSANLPLEDSSIDVVFMLHVLEHLKNPEKTLAEIKRVLTLDGKLILATPWKENIVGRNMNDEHVYTDDELSEVLKNAGFSEQTFFVKPDNSAWRVHCRKRWLAHHLPLTGKLRTYFPWQVWDKGILRLGIANQPLTSGNFSLSRERHNCAIDLLALAS